MSATIPAPPEGSSPAIVSTTGLVIEQPYCGHATCARIKTFTGVVEVNTTNRQHRKTLQSARNVAKFFQSLRLAESSLRFRLKHRTENGKVCSICSRVKC